MARKRKRDWPQRVYKYAVTSADIPQAMWDQAKLMQALWNKLCEMHAAVRSSIIDQTTEEERKVKWSQFELDALAAAKASGLKQECDADVLDRFTKACVAAAKQPQRGWPRPRGLSVSIRHRYGGGGIPLATLVSDRATRVRINGPLSFDASSRQYSAARKGNDSRYRQGVFQLNNSEHIRFTIQQHEPIKPAAIVKSVRWVGRRTVAFGWRWSLIVQVEEPAPPARIATGKECAIDVGWRKLGDSIRVAMLVDSDGRVGQLLLPLDFSTRDSRKRNQRFPGSHAPESHDELRALSRDRDLKLEAVKDRLRGILNPLPAGFDRMRGRGLVKLLQELPDCRARQLIETWLDWDRPRFRSEARARERFANRRIDLYRNIAARIAKRYDVIYVEKLDVKKMIEDSDKAPALHAADRYHQIAATSDFLQCVQNSAKKYGSRVVKKLAALSTARCSACGAPVETGPSRELTCENGHTMDQDENAARNLISQTWPDFVQDGVLRTFEITESSGPSCFSGLSEGQQSIAHWSDQ